MATSLNNLAGLYEAQCHYAEAESRYKWALAINARTLPDKFRYLQETGETLRLGGGAGSLERTRLWGAGRRIPC